MTNNGHTGDGLLNDIVQRVADELVRRGYAKSPHQLLTIPQTAQKLAFKEGKVYGMISSGVLTAVRLTEGGDIRIDEAEVDALIAKKHAEQKGRQRKGYRVVA